MIVSLFHHHHRDHSKNQTLYKLAVYGLADAVAGNQNIHSLKKNSSLITSVMTIYIKKQKKKN